MAQNSQQGFLNDWYVNKRQILAGFGAVLLLAWFCYVAAFGADFQLDDQINLGALASISDTQSAIDFIISGTSGPIGRPLSLLTFALQADQWQHGAESFLRINVLIHLLNAILLAWCVRQIFIMRGEGDTRATMLACTVSSVWVLLPLLATSTLLVVQRMTTLSALLLLLSLVAYLAARSTATRTPRRALFLMTVSLVVGTVLATLAKESGLLLPTFVLVLEGTLLSRPEAIRAAHWKKWSVVFLWMPTILIVTYLATRSSYPDHMIARRGFDAGERLLTEAQLLWLYLSKALIGLPGRLGIYHPEFEVARSLWSPLTLLATLSWIATLIAAVVWRRRFPFFAFAVLWYLAGHLIESTIVPLELYFEHRNYLPVIGPILGITAFLILHSDVSRKAARIAIPIFLLMNAWFVYSIASLTGNPSQSSRYWAAKHPDSVRAVTNLATHQLTEVGIDRGLQTLTEFVQLNPDFAYLRIQELNIGCLVAPHRTQPGRVAEIRKQLASAKFSYTASEMLSQLSATSFASECVDVTPDTVISLAEALRQNPRYVGDPLYNQMHHKLLASIRRQQGNLNATRRHLANAFGYRSSPDLVMMMTMTLAEAGDLDAARDFLQDARQKTPRSPLRAIVWRRNIDDLQNYLNAVEEQSRK